MSTARWREESRVRQVNLLRPLPRIQGMRFGRELRAVLLAGLVVVLTSGCTPETAQRQSRAVPPDASRSGTAEPTRPAVTGEEIANAAQAVSAGTTIGTAVYDRRDGKELLAVNPDRQFRAASVVKLLIGIDALRRSPSAADRVTRMLTYSSNRIANSMWAAGGGGAIVHRMAERIGLQHTAPPRIPGRWGNTVLSARDVVTIYRHVLTELPDSDRKVIVRALAATARYAADGWNQYFGIPEGIGEPWAIKQGWGSTARTLLLHSTGLVGSDRRYVVVLLTEHPRPGHWETLRHAITTAARATAPLVT